ncbi:MAG: ABC transporter permease [Candidatus Ornithospirochaeta sp.]|nr:iron ABC transporter permease [Sphaerochaetaceae bacterium]MDY5522655.1 iron ABC transporter permease [Candidatus Ornithospirochaeta sp.]
MKKKRKFDFWVIASLVILGLYLLFMVYPLFKIVRQSVLDEKTGEFTMRYFIKFFSQPYYFRTLINSFKVAIAACVLSLILGVPLAYLYNMYEIKGRKTLQMLIILSSMSAPFIGAYAWVKLLGRAGVITKFIKAITGITIPSIYGFNGILLVLSLKLFPLVFLYVSGAMKNVDNSLLEASANMGISGAKRFFKVVLPLCMPSILAATLMVFMRAIADFGTPLMIGEGYTTFPVIIYNEYVGEVGTNHNFASAIAVLAILITLGFFLIQRYLTNRNSFSMSAMHHIERTKAKPVMNILIHLYAYGLVAIALLPQVYLIYLSFRKTNPGGEVFQPGFSLDSYRYVFDRMGNTIWNTIRICGSALILIIALAVLISYLTVRRRNVLNACIDTLSMVPYIIPGAVVGISLILAFNNPVLPLVGTATIMIVSMCIRRIPYTIRSSVAILAQIPLSIDEAAESLGAGKVKTLLKVTLPMMFSGVFAGAVMSWVTLITELSSSLLLYSFRTQTLNVAVYKAVGNGTDGRACALATIVTVFTVISLLIFNKISKDGEIML